MQQFSGSRSIKLAKAVLILLLAVIAFEIAWAVKTINSPVVPAKTDSILEISGGKIALVPQRMEYEIGETVPVKIRVATGGKVVDSADVVLRFDPEVLQATGPADFIKGDMFGEYPLIGVDQKGIIKIGALTPPGGKSFAGVGKLGVVNFTAKKAGQTTVSVEFSQGLSSDSNIIVSGATEDILTEVFNLNLEIKDRVVSKEMTVHPSMGCSGYTQYCQNKSGKIGTQFCKNGGEVDGICNYDPLYTFGCLPCKMR